MKLEDIPDTPQGIGALAIIRGMVSVYLRDSEPKSARIQGAVKLLEQIDLTVTEEELVKLMKEEAGRLEERKDIFHPEDGVIKHFALNNQPISAVKHTSNRYTAIDKIIERIVEFGVENLNITQSAISEKQSILNILKLGLENSNEKGDAPPFNNEELEIMKVLVSKLDVDPNQKFEEKESEWTHLKALSNSMTDIDVLKVEERDKYYEYWKDINTKFIEFNDYITYINPMLNQFHELLSDTEKELGTKLGAKILPNYIVKLSPISREEYMAETKSARVVYDFLRFIGSQVPESLKHFKDKDDLSDLAFSTVQEEVGFDEMGNPIGGGRGGSYDEAAVHDLETDIEDAIETLEKENVFVDPLYALFGRDNSKAKDFQPEVLEGAKEQIKNILKTNEASEYFDELQELLDEEIDLFLENYEGATTSIGTDFYLPIMDNDSIVKYFDATEITVEVEYSHQDEVKTRTFDKYSEAAHYINRETKNFFKIIGEVLQITLGTIKIPTRTIDSKSSLGGEEGQQQYWLGGESVALPVKLSEANAEKLQDIPNLIEYIREYYMQPLGGSMVLLGDLPEFYTSPEFRDLPKHIKGSRKQKVKLALKEGYEPFIDSRDYGKVMDWLSIFKDIESVQISKDLIDKFTDGMNAFVKFWQIIQTVAEEGKDEMGEIVKEVKTVMGALLYEIAYDSLGGDETRMSKYLWKRKPLSYWSKEQSDNNYSIENLLGLLEDPDWKTFIDEKMAKDSQLRKKHEQLIYMLKQPIMKRAGEITNAMLQATDMLRKMQGLRIYKSDLDTLDIDDLSYVIDLIKLEDKVDIYGVDIHNIVKSEESFNTISTRYGVSDTIIYKIKGMFR